MGGHNHSVHNTGNMASVVFTTGALKRMVKKSENPEDLGSRPDSGSLHPWAAPWASLNFSFPFLPRRAVILDSEVMCMA